MIGISLEDDRPVRGKSRVLRASYFVGIVDEYVL
jgi:hypothetical protein